MEEPKQLIPDPPRRLIINLHLDIPIKQVTHYLTKLSDMIRFEYKKKIQAEKLFKFIEHCFNFRKEMQVRLVYKEGKVVQACDVAFNFYYRQPEGNARREDGNKTTNYP